MGLIKGGIVLPDVEYAWDAFYGIGRGGRSRLDIHEGVQSFHGSIPLIYVLFNESREILEMCVGAHSGAVEESKAASGGTITFTETTMVDSAENFETSNNVKDGNFAVFSGHSIGYILSESGTIAEVTVYPTPARAGTAGWNGPIPVSGASGDGYEIRRSESVGLGATVKYTVPISQLLTMTWAAQFRGTLGQKNTTINYVGGKVNRFTLSARSGEKLQLSLDDVIFRDLVHDINITGGAEGTHKEGTLGGGGTLEVYTPTPATHPTETPLVFSQGDVRLPDDDNTQNVLTRITSFSMTVDNQLTEQHYIDQSTTSGVVGNSQIPFEITEGTRIIKCEIEGFLDSQIYYQLLVRELTANNTNRSGFDIILRFLPDAAGAEQMIIRCPTAPDSVEITTVDVVSDFDALSNPNNIGCVLEAAPHSIPAETESLIPVRMRFDCPNMLIWYDDTA